MLYGNAVSGGVAIGPVLCYVPFQPVVTEDTIPKNTVSQALAAYEQALVRAQEELTALEERLSSDNPEQAGIMAAHREILLDPVMDEEIRDLVTGELFSPDTAIDQVYGMYARILGESENERMKERAADLRDVKNRLLRCWMKLPEKNLSSLDRPVIVVANDLYPSDTAGIDRKNVLGIITQVGGRTSHTAIIARSYQIPAVLGVGGAMDILAKSETVILDGETGEIFADPARELVEEYREKARRLIARRDAEREYLDTEPVTRDGTRIQVRINVAAVTEQDLSGGIYADGCGLFRTEFLYLDREVLPSEEEQYAVYSKVLEVFSGRPVILRTMDIGGDKQLPTLAVPQEDNPFLGIRGLRLSLEREELFRTQVRAILRASVHGTLKVMMPMVGGLEEVRRAKEIFAQEQQKLESGGIPWKSPLSVGIMVEVPSIALIADLAAEEVDFVSIGTNDLTQYLCAADRMNPLVAEYYQEYHPAVFRMISYLSQTFRKAGKDLSICGELGGDPLAIPALIGMGIQQLSMGAASLAGAKRVIRSLELTEAQELSRQILGMKTQEEIRQALKEFNGRLFEKEN